MRRIVVLMDGRKAMITYVKERVRRSRLMATEVRLALEPGRRRQPAARALGRP